MPNKQLIRTPGPEQPNPDPNGVWWLFYSSDTASTCHVYAKTWITARDMAREALGETEPYLVPMAYKDRDNQLVPAASEYVQKTAELLLEHEGKSRRLKFGLGRGLPIKPNGKGISLPSSNGLKKLLKI
jgi:hypothetical protein